jgi:c-di-AMP phosphodiesterase-like protein
MFMKIVKNCLSGLYALVMDPAGVLCLLSLVIITFLAFEHRVSDMAVVGGFTAISSLAVLMKHKSFQGADVDQPTPTITTVVNNIKAQI